MTRLRTAHLGQYWLLWHPHGWAHTNRYSFRIGGWYFYPMYRLGPVMLAQRFH